MSAPGPTRSSAQPTIGLIAIGTYDYEPLSKSLSEIPAALRPQIRGLLIPVVEGPAPVRRHDGYARTTDMTDLQRIAEQFDLPVTVVLLPPEDAKYGVVHKIALGWAIDEQFDVAAVVHASGHFPMSSLDRMIAPIAAAKAGAVFARRVSKNGTWIPRGISWWKLLGNRYLCSVLSRIVGHTSREWLCPFRAYSTSVLRSMPFRNNSDETVFDFEMLVGCVELREPLAEFEVPVAPDTAFNLSDCVRLAKDAVIAALRYRLHKMGFGTGSTAFNSLAYEVKVDENSSHDSLLRWLRGFSSGRILDVGCSDGRFGQLLEEMGHRVTGVDIEASPGVEQRISRFVRANLEEGLSQHFEKEFFDIVVLADVLEHVRSPEILLREARALVKPGGSILVSIPNIGHWYGRLKVGLGLFSYDRRGLFDSGHLRFFTRVNFHRIVAVEQLEITRFGATSTPIVNVLSRAMRPTEQSSISEAVIPSVSKALAGISAGAIRFWPTLFGYQLLFELKLPARSSPGAVRLTRLDPAELSGSGPFRQPQRRDARSSARPATHA
jgi:SAM-dependent methyltransferase